MTRPIRRISYCASTHIPRIFPVMDGLKRGADNMWNWWPFCAPAGAATQSWEDHTAPYRHNIHSGACLFFFYSYKRTHKLLFCSVHNSLLKAGLFQKEKWEKISRRREILSSIIVLCFVVMMEKEEGIVGIIKNYSKTQQPEAYSSKCTASFSVLYYYRWIH